MDELSNLSLSLSLSLSRPAPAHSLGPNSRGLYDHNASCIRAPATGLRFSSAVTVAVTVDAFRRKALKVRPTTVPPLFYFATLGRNRLGPLGRCSHDGVHERPMNVTHSLKYRAWACCCRGAQTGLASRCGWGMRSGHAIRGTTGNVGAAQRLLRL